MLVILDKLNFYLYKFWGFLKPRRKLGVVSFVILASLLVVVLVVGTNVVHADFIPTAGDIMKWFAEIILTVAGWFIKLTFFILKFVIEVAGYNGFIDSQAVIVGWVMVRDVTNMFFVVVLLLIAFGTILGLEQYEWKKLLVKLLMAAVVVNFSRIICGLIIDVAQVVMITFVNGVAATAAGNLVNMFKVDKILKLSDDPSGIGSPSQMFLAAVAAITFAAIMMVTMLTFLFLLMARMLTLWILIVLSPFAFVLNVLPQTQKYAGQWWSEFGGNVVAGPIIAFFLWLSFVTVGAGNAHDSIRDNNALSNQNLIDNGTVDSNEESTGITKIMTWAQMANFAIAIGMLLAGAKMAQQLGAAGGSMMGKAGEFGKKVAMTASGLTAARWAGKQALAGAKGAGKLGLKGVDFGLSKVGLSTEDWKRRGRNIKSSVLASYYDKQALKTRKASEIAKALAVDEKGEYVNKGVGGWAKRMLARGRLQFGGYGSFNEEYSGDLEANVKNRQELIEHLASISSTKVGQEKQRSAEELKFNKETGAGIKAGKEAVMDERRLKINQIIAKGGDVDAALAGMGLDSGEIAQVRADYGRLGKANVGKAAAKITGEYTGAAQGKREAEAMEKYMAGEGMKQEEKTSELKAQTQQIQSQLAAEREQEELRAIYNLIKDQGLGEARQKKLTAKKAELESTKEMMDLQKNKAVLLARATEYRDANRPGGPDLLKATLAEQQAHSLELNKLKEVYKTAEIGANERGNIAAQLVQQMEEVRNSALSGPEKEKALKSLVKQKDSLHDFSSTQSSYDAIREEEEELRQLKWDEPINNENVGRRFLSRRLGKKVNAGQEKEALNEYRNLVGDDEYKVRMRQLGAHAKIQQSQGNAGAFVYKESPNRVNGQLTGLTDYEPVVRTGAEIIGDMSGWLKNNYIDTKKILQATGTRRLGEAPGSGSVLININDAEAKFNAEALGTFTSQSIASMGKRGFIGDLNGSAIDKASLTKQLSAFVAKATDKRAFGALTNNLKDVLEKLKIEQKELDELWSSSGKPDVNPQGKGK